MVVENNVTCVGEAKLEAVLVLQVSRFQVPEYCGSREVVSQPGWVVRQDVDSKNPTNKCTVEPLSNRDTNGTEESVIVSEVSFQRLKCMQEWYLGWEKVSCLECPQFRSVLSSALVF